MRVLSLVVVAFVPLFLVSCDEGDDDDPVPPPPIVLTLERDGADVMLTWTDTLAEDGFRVMRDTDDSGVPTEIATPAAGSGFYVDTGLANSVKYTYYVEGLSLGAVIGTSASVTAEYVKLLSPLGGATYAIGDTVNITWETNKVGSAWVIKALPAGNDAAQVHESGAVSGFAWKVGYASDGTSANALPFLAIGDTSVTIRVHYYQALGHQTVDSPAPLTVESPIDLAVSRVGSDVSLTWTDTASEDGFSVWRDEDESGTPLEIATPAAGVGTCADAGLLNGVKYTYYVQALSGGSQIGLSFNATPEYIKILAPNGGLSYPLGNAVSIVWETNIVGATWVIKALYGSADVAQVHESGAVSGFSWQAGYETDGTNPNATPFITVDDPNVTIRVHYDAGLAHQTDDSDAVFTIDVP